MSETVVRLNIYDLYELRKLNKFALPLGFGAFHSGVEVFGLEFSFGFPHGVFAIPPRSAPNARFKTSIKMGHITLKRNRVKELLVTARDCFPPEDYHILNKNCHHFCDLVCQLLVNKSIPKYLNKLPKFVSYFATLIPAEKLAPTIPSGEKEEVESYDAFAYFTSSEDDESDLFSPPRHISDDDIFGNENENEPEEGESFMDFIQFLEIERNKFREDNKDEPVMSKKDMKRESKESKKEAKKAAKISKKSELTGSFFSKKKNRKNRSYSVGLVANKKHSRKSGSWDGSERNRIAKPKFKSGVKSCDASSESEDDSPKTFAERKHATQAKLIAARRHTTSNASKITFDSSVLDTPKSSQRKRRTTSGTTVSPIRAKLVKSPPKSRRKEAQKMKKVARAKSNERKRSKGNKGSSNDRELFSAPLQKQKHSTGTRGFLEFSKSGVDYQVTRISKRTPLRTMKFVFNCDIYLHNIMDENQALKEVVRQVSKEIPRHKGKLIALDTLGTPIDPELKMSKITEQTIILEKGKNYKQVQSKSMPEFSASPRKEISQNNSTPPSKLKPELPATMYYDGSSDSEEEEVDFSGFLLKKKPETRIKSFISTLSNSTMSELASISQMSIQAGGSDSEPNNIPSNIIPSSQAVTEFVNFLSCTVEPSAPEPEEPEETKREDKSRKYVTPSVTELRAVIERALAESSDSTEAPPIRSRSPIRPIRVTQHRSRSHMDLRRSMPAADSLSASLEIKPKKKKHPKTRRMRKTFSRSENKVKKSGEKANIEGILPHAHTRLRRSSSVTKQPNVQQKALVHEIQQRGKRIRMRSISLGRPMSSNNSRAFETGDKRSYSNGLTNSTSSSDSSPRRIRMRFNSDASESNGRETEPKEVDAKEAFKRVLPFIQVANKDEV